MSTPFTLETNSWISTSSSPELFVAEKVLKRVKGNNQSNLTNETIKIHFNLSTGALEFRDSNNNLIVSFNKDSRSPDFTSDDYDQYFSETNASTRGQYDTLLTWSKQQALAIAFDDGPESYERISTAVLYRSTANSSNAPESSNADGSDNNTSDANPTFPAPIAGSGSGGSDLLRYPLRVPNLGYDFIRITAFKYQPGGSESLSLTNPNRGDRRGDTLETIILPMQPNFSESNAVGWGGDKVNPLQMIGAQAAIAGIKAIGNPADMISTMSTAAGSIGDQLKEVIEDEKTGPAIIAYFAGQAVGANIGARTTGTVLNPNLELLFSGPNLRTFQFNFRMTPRDHDESLMIKKIIRTLKKNMAVQRSSSKLFLSTPNIFQLEYIYNSDGPNGGQQHPYLNKFKMMAMTSFNVNYTPDGTYMTYGRDGSLTAYDINMAFGELEPIYADDYDDQFTDMGF